MDRNDIQPHYLTVASAAKYTGYSVSSIRRFLRDGKLKPTSDVGHPRFTIRQLDQFMHRRKSVASVRESAKQKATVTGSLQAAMDRAQKARCVGRS